MTTPFSVLEDPSCPNPKACTSSQAILNPAYLPKEALYGDGGADSVGWQLSKSPFGLSQERLNDIHRFGGVLYQWMKAIDFLYKESVKGKMPGWIATLLDQGKPEALIRYSRMNRFKNTLPSV
ncbi:MAG: hypothetical protein K2X66_07750, partial [Cyanobacteria bacterium]|nr:hypothetical protein [Cyanobacteriota bacterium]